MGSISPLRRFPRPLCVPAKPPPELWMLLASPQQPSLKMSSLFLLFGGFFRKCNASHPVPQFSLQFFLMPYKVGSKSQYL